MKNKNLKIKYDTEADVLSWEISGKGKIDYASELDNIVVHFTGEHIPVLIEVLNASKLLKQSDKTVERARELALAP